MVRITDNTSFESESYLVRVKDIVMTDMSMSKVYFVDKSKNDKLLILFTIQSYCPPCRHVAEPSISQISVTPNHIMLKVRADLIEDDTSDTSSSDNTKDRKSVV